MPELPEVENTRRYLEEIGLPGRTFSGVSIGWARSVRTPALEDFVLGIPNRRIMEIRRRGKYLVLPLTENGSDRAADLILHLGMTGGLRVHPRAQPVPPMVRHTFFLEDDRELRFIDPRKFGHLWLVPDWEDALPPFGPEPLDDSFTSQALAKILNARHAPIKALLLEQSVVAGLGNLYADETLFLAGIHPIRPADSLSGDEISKLRKGIVAALTSALHRYDQSRAEGWPDPPFGLSTWTIPRKIDEACPRCGASMVGIRVRARSTFFCPDCQPLE